MTCMFCYINLVLYVKRCLIYFVVVFSQLYRTYNPLYNSVLCYIVYIQDELKSSIPKAYFISQYQRVYKHDVKHT